jgi:hypothetical protein
MGDNIIDCGGAGESPACDEGHSIIRGDIKGRGIASVEIGIVLLIAGNVSSSR